MRPRSANALTATFVLLTIAAALFGLTRFNQLRNAAQLSAANASVERAETRMGQAEQQLAVARLTTAQDTSQAAVLDEALATNEAILEGLETARIFLSSLCGSERNVPRIRMPDIPEATELLNRCSDLKVFLDRTSARLPRGFSTLAGRRVRARTEADLMSLDTPIVTCWPDSPPAPIRAGARSPMKELPMPRTGVEDGKRPRAPPPRRCALNPPPPLRRSPP